MDITQRCHVHERSLAHYDIDLDRWSSPKPFGISGMFRLKNESQFMEAAILSHLPHLDEAVLVVQNSNDDTIAHACDLAALHPNKIRVAHYPFSVHPIATEGHFSSPENSAYTMMHLTNWAISRCNYSWIAKIEGDVIALPTFADIRSHIEANPLAIRHYGRVGLNVAGDGSLYSHQHPRNAGWDESIFNNSPTWYCIRADKWESINMNEHRDYLTNMGWSFIHTKRMKGGLPGIETWQPLTEANLSSSLAAYNSAHSYPGPDNPLGVKSLFDSKWMEWL